MTPPLDHLACHPPHAAMSKSSLSSRKRAHPDSEAADHVREGTACAIPISQAGDDVNVSGDAQLQPSVEGGAHRCSSETSRLTSPPLSSNGSNVGDPPVPATHARQTSPAQPAKRRKMTFAEKERVKIEKELKEKQKAGEKATKDEEKGVREGEKRRKEEEGKEEKRKREEEKEEKKRARELEKSAKEEEKRKKDEEKAKKDEEKAKKERVRMHGTRVIVVANRLQSQMRLNAFFVKPSTTSPGAVGTPPTERRNPMDGRRSSVGSMDDIDISTGSRSSSSSPQKIRQSDYERLFPPFHLQSHTVLAPYNRFGRDVGALELARAGIDDGLQSSWNGLETVLGKRKALETYAVEQLHIPPNKRTKRAAASLTVKSIMERINGTEDDPIDLTDGERKRMDNPAKLLKSIWMKHLQFAEDVRPPYRGTYTKLPIKQSPLSLARKPFERALPQTNYDYDSEAEWEEPGEGEDLNSEGEEDHGSDDEEDEMEGFLDDEDTGDAVAAAGNKRRQVVGNFEPVSSGLCWEDSHGNFREQKDGENDSKPSLKAYRLELILGTLSRPCRGITTDELLQKITRCPSTPFPPPTGPVPTPLSLPHPPTPPPQSPAPRAS